MVKNNTFNGICLPSIALRKEDGSIQVIRRFGYQDSKAGCLNKTKIPGGQTGAAYEVKQMIVAKFGGSSLADAAQFRRCGISFWQIAAVRWWCPRPRANAFPRTKRSPICFTSATRPGRRGSPSSRCWRSSGAAMGRLPEIWGLHWIWTASSADLGADRPGGRSGLLRQPGRVCQRPAAGGISGVFLPRCGPGHRF